MHPGKHGLVVDGLHACTRHKLTAMVGKLSRRGLSKKEKLWRTAVCEMAARTTEVWLDARIKNKDSRSGVTKQQEPSLKQAYESAQVETMFQYSSLAERLAEVSLARMLRGRPAKDVMLEKFVLTCIPERYETFGTDLKKEIEDTLRPKGAKGRFVSPKVPASQSLGVNGHNCNVVVIAASNNGHAAGRNGQMIHAESNTHLAGVGAK